MNFGTIFKRKYVSVAEWSKALVLGTSLSGGVGSNPTTASLLTFLELSLTAKKNVNLKYKKINFTVAFTNSS